MARAATDTSGTNQVIVLVVEDNALQRMDLVETIEDAGYIAVEAKDADQAIEIIESRTDIRLVFTDIDMPGSQDGLRLAAVIRDRWPPVEIILTTSGRHPDPKLLPTRALFVPKPFAANDAIRAIRNLLNAN